MQLQNTHRQLPETEYFQFTVSNNNSSLAKEKHRYNNTRRLNLSIYMLTPLYYLYRKGNRTRINPIQYYMLYGSILRYITIYPVLNYNSSLLSTIYNLYVYGIFCIYYKDSYYFLCQKRKNGSKIIYILFK